MRATEGTRGGGLPHGTVPQYDALLPPPQAFLRGIVPDAPPVPVPPCAMDLGEGRNTPGAAWAAARAAQARETPPSGNGRGASAREMRGLSVVGMRGGEGSLDERMYSGGDMDDMEAIAHGDLDAVGGADRDDLAAGIEDLKCPLGRLSLWESMGNPMAADSGTFSGQVWGAGGRDSTLESLPCPR